MGKPRIAVGSKDARTSDDGIVFDSIKEKIDYYGFRALLKSGAIRSLEVQVRFPLLAASVTNPGVPVRIAHYVADFVVTEKDGTRRVYDSKGYRTEMYKLKKKFVEACHGIRIVEI